MNIYIAKSDNDIAACYPVMRELRPHIAEDRFLAQVRRQQGAGYRQVMAQECGTVVAVAGFRVAENLAWGRFLYVDDLVTLPAQRSKGHGAALLSWLRECAAAATASRFRLSKAGRASFLRT